MCAWTSDCPARKVCVDGRCRGVGPTGDGGASDAADSGLEGTDDNRPRAIAVTAGGGSAASRAYQLQARIGAPEPMGACESRSYRLVVGLPTRGETQ